LTTFVRPTGESRAALAAGALCYVLWGGTGLLFMAMGRAGASPFEIVAQRAVWSAPWAFVLVLLARQTDQVRLALRSPKLLAALAGSALAISSGWIVYVWAVNHGKNIESSLGYFITPLLNMAAGAVLFRERIDRLGLIAVALAAAGVAIQTLSLGHPPFIALFLASTLWVYGLIRRHLAIDAQAGLFLECLFIAAPGVLYVLWLAHAGTGLFGRTLAGSVFLMTAGPVTVLPLALFSWTARRLNLSTVGFLQFISPTLGFMVGLANGERLNRGELISFLFIWTGVAVFILGAWRAWRRA
jgi:chloramphenicol-sensitive protein RarD